MTKPASLFGTDGIRGTANVYPMTADVAMKCAMATATVFSGDNGAGTYRVVIGKDTRLSGYMFEEAMAAGFVAMGMEVVLVGPIPTPGIAMLTRSLRADLGVMISASHNAYRDNGIKLFASDGFKLQDVLEQKISALITDPALLSMGNPDKIGKATRLDDALGRYIESSKSTFPRGQTLKGLKIVVDCANGAAYRVAPQVLWELEADVIAMNVTPDGRNINDECGATHPQGLQQAVRDHQADLGIALDGDADRVILVDEQGNVIDGDQLMAVMADDWRGRRILSHKTLVATVMSNLGLERFLASRGVVLERTSVGDRYVVERMRSGGFNLGGEQSGHIVMTDYGTTGDGMLAALQALAILKSRGAPASSVFHAFDPVPQVLKSVRYDRAEGSPMDRADVRDAIVAGESTLRGTGRLLVRASGTEPVIRVMAEGDDAAMVARVVDQICGIIQK